MLLEIPEISECKSLYHWIIIISECSLIGFCASFNLKHNSDGTNNIKYSGIYIIPLDSKELLLNLAVDSTKCYSSFYLCRFLKLFCFQIICLSMNMTIDPNF